MSIRNLDKLFKPKSVAVFGASERDASVGKAVTKNLSNGDFAGPVWLVNPKHKKIFGVKCYHDTNLLPEAPDLAVIATPAKTIPGIISQLAEKGTKAAIVITAGLRQQDFTQEMLDFAQPHCLRIVGPNCIGLMVPEIGLNASFAHSVPLKGDLAFISQSGAIIGAGLDWATGKGIGFSTIVSMGNMADVDLGDILDYLAADNKTRAILMYVEHVTHAAKFMSAARSAARVKPVIVIKSGRHEEAAKAAHSHTGALTGSDAVYSAAFHRAGMLRVQDLEDLFDAAEVLSRHKPIAGNRLAIVSNGGGAGVLAVDRLIDFGGVLAELSDETIARLNKVLPSTWSKANPVDIIGDAGPERYRAAIEAVLDDPGSDAVLVINCPTALASSTDAAKATIEAIEQHNKKQTRPKPVLTNWLGDASVRDARKLFSQNKYPTFFSPADAVRGFKYLTRHAKDQTALMQTPPSLPERFSTDPETARKLIQPLFEEGREVLTEAEAKSVLNAYGIPTVNTIIAKTPADVEEAAATLIDDDGTEIVIKILSKDITHKSDLGGVSLGLPSADAAKAAALEMLVRIETVMPEADIEGFTVQPMIRRPHAHELIIGVSNDQTFGPVILFGTGGTAVEVIGDTSLALPPLNLKLAHDLISETRAFSLLRGYRDQPAADMDAIALTLVRVSQMIAELPEIYELDINPLLVDEGGVIALDARIAVKDNSVKTGELNPHFSIRPYPKQWEGEEKLADGKTIMIRPIRPDDENLYETFMEKTSMEDMRLRLFGAIRHPSHKSIARLTQIDYARAMAFIAIDPDLNEMLGVSRLASNADYVRAEFAIITRSDMKRRGIGWALMQRLIHYAETENIKELFGQVLTENNAMLKMCRDLGCQIHSDPDNLSYHTVTMPLHRAQ